MSPQYPIFIISLADAENRRKPLLDQLTEQGLDWEVFHAIDAQNGVPDQYEPLINREKSYKRMRRAMTEGEYGCALSHRAVYEKIIDDDLPGAIILEDDAILHSQFGDFIRTDDLTYADMFIFDYLRVSVSRWQKRISVFDIELHKVLARPTRATGYSLSKQGAKKMLKATTPITHAADWPCDLYDIGAWATFPKLINHPDDDAETSSLERERSQLANKLARKDPMRYLAAEYWRRKIAKRVG